MKLTVYGQRKELFAKMKEINKEHLAKKEDEFLFMKNQKKILKYGLAGKEQKVQQVDGSTATLVEKTKNQVVKSAVHVAGRLRKADLKEKDIQHADQPHLLAVKKASGAKNLKPKRKGRKNENYKITIKPDYRRRN